MEMAGYLKPDNWRFDAAGKIIRSTPDRWELSMQRFYVA